jgi:hypothetical protein
MDWPDVRLKAASGFKANEMSGIFRLNEFDLADSPCITFSLTSCDRVNSFALIESLMRGLTFEAEV